MVAWRGEVGRRGARRRGVALTVAALSLGLALAQDDAARHPNGSAMTNIIQLDAYRAEKAVRRHDTRLIQCGALMRIEFSPPASKTKWSQSGPIPMLV